MTVSNATPPSPTGMVAGYAFDEGSGTSAADASGHGIGGTLTNGASWAAGKYVGAVSLDGIDDYVDLGNPTALRLTGSMTVSAWINSSAFPGDDAPVVSKRGGSVGFQLDTTIDSGPRKVGFKLTSSTGADMIRYGTTPMQTNTWYHIAGVYDAVTATLNVYLNGQVEAGAQVGDVTSTQLDSAQNVLIGRRWNGSDLFNGRIDDVRIYDRALTAAEIQADMADGLGLPSGDAIPPTVSITAPTAGTQVSGIVNVTAAAADNIVVQAVQFYVDGVAAGAEDSSAPYGLAWDTRAAANGSHTLTARARDAAGNNTLSAGVAVNVANASSFQNEVLATGFNLPTNIEFLPDGRLLVIELAGKIRILPPPYTTPDPALFLQIANIGSAGVQQGIYDIALDPAFTTNHFYYVFYTLGTPNRDRLSRFTANATHTGTVAGSEVVLYQDPQDADPEHHGGAIVFGNDGKLYFTTGDNATAWQSQDSTSPRGKIHRINTDGTIPTDDPFYDGAGPHIDSIWALGLRNPYRAFYDAPTGRLYFGDVGGNDNSTADEEVELGARGANYGWPDCEGTCGSPVHAARSTRIRTTGATRDHRRLRLPRHAVPQRVPGQLLLRRLHPELDQAPDLRRQRQRQGRLQLRAGRRLRRRPVWRHRLSHRRPGRRAVLRRPRLLGLVARSASARSAASDTSVATSLRSRSASADPDVGTGAAHRHLLQRGVVGPRRPAADLRRDFGDGTTSTAANPTHTYTKPGSTPARLTVSDGSNTTLVAARSTISAGNPPPPTITAPQDGAFFAAGDVITFSGTATDAEDGTLPASAFTWNIDFLHEGHVHPGTPITGVKSGTFTIPTTGHDFSGNTRYRIMLTVTDSSGLTSSSR